MAQAMRQMAHEGREKRLKTGENVSFPLVRELRF
jgi:hypothetical protein